MKKQVAHSRNDIKKHKRYDIWRKLSACFSLLLLMHTAASVQAVADFTVQPVFPDVQTDASLGYYDVACIPGEELQLSLLLHNTGGQALTLSLEAVSTSEGMDGTIQYAAQSNPEGPFEKITQGLPVQVVVPAQSSFAFEFLLTMPEADLLGAIVVRNALGNNAPRIRNAYAYTIAVHLHPLPREDTP